MGQVAINLNGRLYRFDCGDGEEPRLEELAAFVKGRLDALSQEYGNVGDDRLMLTAALLITDELLDARAALEELAAESLAAHQGKAPANASLNGQAKVPAGGEKREQEAPRSEHRRKAAAGGEA